MSLLVQSCVLLRRFQRGLTLLELLLTVVIFSLVVTIFSQAIFQIGQFERASARSMGGLAREWAKGFTLDDYFRAQVLAPEADLLPVGGDALSFTSWWMEGGVGGLAGRPVRVVLSLKPVDEGRSGWGLFVQVPTVQGSQDAKGGEGTQMAHWDRAVTLRYVNAQGVVSSVWPVVGVDDGVSREALPRAVRVVDGSLAIVHQWNFLGLSQPGIAQASRSLPFFGGGGTP